MAESRFYNCGLEAQYQQQIADTLAFFAALFIRNLNFLHHLHSVFLFVTRKSDNCLHSANIIANAESHVNSLQKNLKTNETRIFAQGLQGRWIFSSI